MAMYTMALSAIIATICIVQHCLLLNTIHVLTSFIVPRLKEGLDSGGGIPGSTVTPPSRRRRTPATPPSTGL